MVSKDIGYTPLSYQPIPLNSARDKSTLEETLGDPEISEELSDHQSEEYKELLAKEQTERRSKIEELQILLEEKRADEDRLLEEISRVKPKFEVKRNKLLNEIAIKEAEVLSREDRIARIIAGPETEPPPGPKSLRWVEEPYFLGIASAVIFLNTITIVLETVNESYEKEFFWIDQFFMAFYIFEICVKWRLWRRRFLCDDSDDSSRIRWNWLDLGIVMSGIMDMYIQPMLVHAGAIHGRSPTLSKISRFIRFLRLLRILKLVRVFMESDLDWIQEPPFQIFIMSVIGINSIVMGFETDLPDLKCWYTVDSLFLLIFTFELVARLKHEGSAFFHEPETLAWNYIDLVIVVGGIADIWAMPFIAWVKQTMGVAPSGSSGNVGQIMMMLRMLRLLRLLRLVRLVRSIPPLFNLVVGIVQAVQGMVWVLVLTASFLYVMALLCVRLFGHGLVFGGEAPPEVAAIFPSVFQAFFVLFKLMNGDGEDLEPLWTDMPLTKVFFIFYMVVSTWAILSILTAVVSENMISTTEAARESMEESREAERQKYIDSKLNKLFFEMDKNNSNTLTRAEFMEFLEDPVSLQELSQVAKEQLDAEDLRYLFNAKCTMAESGDAEEDYIEIDDFREALARNDDPVKQRAVFRINNRLTCLETVVRRNLKEMMHLVSQTKGTSGFKQKTVQSFLDQGAGAATYCNLASDSKEYEKRKALKSFKEKSAPKSFT
mmetsp:Transcript_29017/g.53224  ORF Transcript_29017/g.53224 Transcript_29017/m.53224 type:complete len:716 (-) Transcript_29017:96-2243(-)